MGIALGAAVLSAVGGVAGAMRVHGDQSEVRQMCMEQAESKELHTPAATAPQQPATRQPSHGAGKPLRSCEVAMRCCTDSTCAPSSLGWGLALGVTGQLLSEAVGIGGCERRM